MLVAPGLINDILLKNMARIYKFKRKNVQTIPKYSSDLKKPLLKSLKIWLLE